MKLICRARLKQWAVSRPFWLVGSTLSRSKSNSFLSPRERKFQFSEKLIASGVAYQQEYQKKYAKERASKINIKNKY